MHKFIRCSLKILSLLMIFTLLCACETVAPILSPTNSTFATSTSTTTPDLLEPYQITWYLGGSPQMESDHVFARFNEVLAERLSNTTVNIEIIKWSEYTERMRILMATREKWDMCFTATWANYFAPAVTRDNLAEIPSEMLLQYGRDIVDVLPDEVWECVTVAGRIMAVPTWQVHCITRGFVIKKELYDKYKGQFDFDAVRSKADIEPFFDLVKKNEKDTICFLSEVNGFGTINDYNVGIVLDELGSGMVVRMDDPTFTIQSYFDQPESMDFFRLMRRWCLSGYIPEDASGIKDWESEQKSGKYAAFEVGNMKPDNAAEFSSIAYPVVDVQFTDSWKTTNTVRPGLIGFSKTSQNLERCIMLTNLMFEDKELYRLLNHGIEGQHYEMLDDGTLHVTGDGYNPGIDWELGNNALAHIREGQNHDIYVRTRERNASAVCSPLFGWSMDYGPVKNEVAQVEAVFRDIYPILGTGSVEPEQYIIEAKERLEKAGLHIVIAEAQRQVNEWLDRDGNLERANARITEYLAGHNGKK